MERNIRHLRKEMRQHGRSFPQMTAPPPGHKSAARDLPPALGLHYPTPPD